MSSNGAVAAAAPAATAAAPSNAFADINGKQFLQQQPAATAPTAAASPPATAAAAAPVAVAPAAKPYNPHANLAQLDASLSLPDESENARLASTLSENVATLMATKQANERKQLVVGSILAEKYKSMEEERGKLMLIRQELAKLDQSLSRNSTTYTTHTRARMLPGLRVSALGGVWLQSRCAHSLRSSVPALRLRSQSTCSAPRSNR